ncbi:hypothetical protein Hanom_Chr02g00141371 [Helianthus anomalus]
MMWHLRKICSNLDLSLRFSVSACQISGRNFFHVGDDVTTQSPGLVSFGIMIVIPLNIFLSRSCFSKFVLHS